METKAGLWEGAELRNGEAVGNASGTK